MDNKETAEHFRSRSSEVPLWHRQNISVEVGHRTMIKRKKFENYLENLSSI